MKRYKILGIISKVLLVIVYIVELMILAGFFKVSRSIRLYAVYPILLAMLIGSVVLWVISDRLRKKNEE